MGFIQLSNRGFIMTRRLFASFTLFALLLAVAATAQAVQPPDVDLVDNGDGTITNIINNLTWQKNVDGTRRNWQAAMDYCNSNTAGLPGSGWRLPDYEELQSVRGSIELTGRVLYWSATTALGSPGRAYSVQGKDLMENTKSYNHYVRCVRY